MVYQIGSDKIKGEIKTNLINNNVINTVSYVERTIGTQTEELFHRKVGSDYTADEMQDSLYLNGTGAYQEPLVLDNGLGIGFMKYEITIARPSALEIPNMMLNVKLDHRIEPKGTSNFDAASGTTEFRTLVNTVDDTYLSYEGLAWFDYSYSFKEYKTKAAALARLKSTVDPSGIYHYKYYGLMDIAIVRSPESLYLDMLIANKIRHNNSIGTLTYEINTKYDITITGTAASIVETEVGADADFDIQSNELLTTDSKVGDVTLAEYIAADIVKRYKHGKQTIEFTIVLNDELDRRCAGELIQVYDIPEPDKLTDIEKTQYTIARHPDRTPETFIITSCEFQYDGEYRQVIKAIESYRG